MLCHQLPQSFANGAEVFWHSFRRVGKDRCIRLQFRRRQSPSVGLWRRREAGFYLKNSKLTQIVGCWMTQSSLFATHLVPIVAHTPCCDRVVRARARLLSRGCLVHCSVWWPVWKTWSKKPNMQCRNLWLWCRIWPTPTKTRSSRRSTWTEARV